MPVDESNTCDYGYRTSIYDSPTKHSKCDISNRTNQSVSTPEETFEAPMMPSTPRLDVVKSLSLKALVTRQSLAVQQRVVRALAHEVLGQVLQMTVVEPIS